MNVNNYYILTFKMSYIIMISGGAGFVGMNMIKYIVENKTATEIIVLDNFITSDPDYFDCFVKKMYDFNPDIKITLYDFDIVNSKLIPFLKERYNIINEIYHLASLASPIAYKRYPLQTLDVGYIGTRNMLELALYYNSKFLLASTSEIYGDAQVSPQSEDYYGNVNSFGSRASYDESKRVAESLVYTYQKVHNVNARIARIFNTYGPMMKMDDGRIITEIIKHLICGTELTIFGNGDQTRSLCHVSNTIDMLVKLMASDFIYPINIGNDVEMSVNDLVVTTIKNYKQFHKSELGIRYEPLTQNDPLIRKPCLKLNKQILGDTNYIPIDIGITDTIKFFLNN